MHGLDKSSFRYGVKAPVRFWPAAAIARTFDIGTYSKHRLGVRADYFRTSHHLFLISNSVFTSPTPCSLISDKPKEDTVKASAND